MNNCNISGIVRHANVRGSSPKVLSFVVETRQVTNDSERKDRPVSIPNQHIVSIRFRGKVLSQKNLDGNASLREFPVSKVCGHGLIDKQCDHYCEHHLKARFEKPILIHTAPFYGELIPPLARKCQISNCSVTDFGK